MSGNSSLNPENLVVPAAARKPREELNTFGPSDSSDSGSDLTDTAQGEAGGDRVGTGERASVEPEAAQDNADLDTDRVVDAEEAGLGHGHGHGSSPAAPATGKSGKKRRM